MRRIVLLLVTMATAFAVGQQTTKHDHKAAASKTAAPQMPMPKPSPEMAKLSKMIVGTWNVSMKIEPMPEMGQPNATTGTGKDVTKLGPGGLSTVSDFNSPGYAGGFRGHGVVWWDSNDQQFHSVWCDNMMPIGCEMAGTGKFDGDKLVMEYTSNAMGQKIHMKETMQPAGPDSYTFNFEMGPEGGALKPAMEFTYKKAAAAEKAKQAGD